MRHHQPYHALGLCSRARRSRGDAHSTSRKGWDPVSLCAGNGRRGLALAVGHEYQIIKIEDDTALRGPWTVETTRYVYAILDELGNEVLTYHWHPEDPFQASGQSTVPTPHLHLSETIQPISLGEGFDPVTLAEMHLRTGRVSLEDIVELLIDELDVRPLHARWRQTLDENRRGALPERPR